MANHESLTPERGPAAQNGFSGYEDQADRARRAREVLIRRYRNRLQLLVAMAHGAVELTLQGESSVVRQKVKSDLTHRYGSLRSPLYSQYW